MQQLLAQNVNAIIFYPLDPKATTPVLRQAQSKKVPVLAIDASFGSTKKVPLIATQVWQGRDTQAYLQAQALAKTQPNAKLGIIGIGIPVPAIKYLVQREAFWAKKVAKASVVGTQDNPSDDVTGGEKAANALLQRNSDIDAVIGYNDPSALGGRHRRAQQRPEDRRHRTQRLERRDQRREVRSTRSNGAGRSDRARETVTRGAYSLITKQNLPLPHIVIRPGRLVTKANVNTIPSWNNQLKAIK